MKRKYILVLLVMSVLIFSGCGKQEPEVDEELVQAATDNFDIIVSNNSENTIYHEELSHFGLLLPGGDKFEWASDPSASEADFSFSFIADEFIAAGLDISSLESTAFTYQEATENSPGVLIYAADVGSEKANFDEYTDAFKNLLMQMPGQLSILENDGYILDLGQGFQAHWNGEERVNKDIAIIIGAEDLIEAGLKIEELSNWKLMKNNDENDTQIKLFKVYYLK